LTLDFIPIAQNPKSMQLKFIGMHHQIDKLSECQ
jgi:hypothetical protein